MKTKNKMPATKASQIMKRRKQIAEQIMSKRQENEMSQDALAKKAGIDRKTINRIENGHFSPSVETLIRIANALNTHPKELLNWK